MEKKLIIKGHDKNPFVKFWNWGWNIYYKNPEVWNYIIVGALTTLVSYLVFFICTLIFNTKNDLELQVCNVISWVFAVLFAYVTNRKFVFKSTNKNIILEFTNFIGARVISLFMDMGIMWLFVSLIGINDMVGKLISQVVVLIANYILSKLLVFRKK